jgi:hypothetical protein
MSPGDRALLIAQIKALGALFKVDPGRVIARWLSAYIPSFRTHFDPGYSNYYGVPWSEFGTGDNDKRVCGLNHLLQSWARG